MDTQDVTHFDWNETPTELSSNRKVPGQSKFSVFLLPSKVTSLWVTIAEELRMKEYVARPCKYATLHCACSGSYELRCHSAHKGVLLALVLIVN